MNEQNKAQNQAQNQTNIQSNQANNQSNQQQVQQKAKQAARNAEAKTVVNGQEVKVLEAQAAEEAFLRSQAGMKTGIQAHHDNSTEAVEAGQVAQNTQQTMNEYQKAVAAVKPHDLQSGQAHLQQYVQEAQQSLQQLEQKMQQQEQQRMQQAQQVQQQQQQAAGTQNQAGLSEQQKVQLEAHQTIQQDLDAKAKAKAKK